MSEYNLESKVVDFKEVFGPYLGKNLFLAVKRDYSFVVATGKGPLEALHNSKENGYSKPILMKAPRDHYWSYIL
ncbi:hypothetical protein JYT44_02540 [Caldithrix abyssi]|nr:hypothetical protein [Caldithrix abyssi]